MQTQKGTLLAGASFINIMVRDYGALLLVSSSQLHIYDSFSISPISTQIPATCKHDATEVDYGHQFQMDISVSYLQIDVHDIDARV